MSEMYVAVLNYPNATHVVIINVCRLDNEASRSSKEQLRIQATKLFNSAGHDVFRATIGNEYQVKCR